MNLLKLPVVLVCLFVAWPASGTTPKEKSKAPQLKSAKPAAFKLVVHNGDKVSHFEIQDSSKPIVIINGRQKQTLPDNVNYAMRLASAASKEKSNNKELCDRKYFSLTFSLKGTKEKQSYGCIGSPTPIAKKLAELSNLMLFM